jgi:molybdopterin-guanine dinucleotide biosynthesis protein A
MDREKVSGFVLVGGKSTRMGTDKAALTLEGRTLLEHAVAIVRQVTGDVAILGPRQLYGGYGVPVIEDIYPGCGPLGGIHAALSHIAQTAAQAPDQTDGAGAGRSQPPGPAQGQKDFPRRLSLIIAVDTPFLEPKFLAYLAQRAQESSAIVTTPEIAGYRQPLCAVYSQEFLPIAEQALSAGSRNAQPEARPGNAGTPGAQQEQSRKSADYKIVPLFPEGRTCVITEAEMRKFAFVPEMFDNLNTPQDLERARRRAADSKP